MTKKTNSTVKPMKAWAIVRNGEVVTTVDGQPFMWKSKVGMEACGDQTIVPVRVIHGKSMITREQVKLISEWLARFNNSDIADPTTFPENEVSDAIVAAVAELRRRQ